jgi:hypothetical protein
LKCFLGLINNKKFFVVKNMSDVIGLPENAQEAVGVHLLKPNFVEPHCVIIRGQHPEVPGVEVGFQIKPFASDELKFSVVPFIHGGKGNKLHQGEAEVLNLKPGDDNLLDNIGGTGLTVHKIQAHSPTELEPIELYNIKDSS